jgi:hypothetical protein
MNPTFEFALRSLLIGTGATLCMDLWAALLRRFGVPSLNFALWAAGWATCHAVAGSTTTSPNRPR